jgi:hypothetical protein
VKVRHRRVTMLGHVMHMLLAFSLFSTVRALITPFAARRAAGPPAQLLSRMGVASNVNELAEVPPATTFMGCVGQATKAAALALSDGQMLLEVDFPPLPIEYLEDSASPTRDITFANTRWAFEVRTLGTLASDALATGQQRSTTATDNLYPPITTPTTLTAHTPVRQGIHRWWQGGHPLPRQCLEKRLH